MKKKTVEVEKVVDKVDEVKHAIPTAGDREVAAAPKHSKVVDRFRKKETPATKAVKADTRPVIDIDDETKQKFVDFAAARELSNIFEEAEKEQTAELYGSIFERYKATLWRSKSQPQNPSIKVNNSKGSLEAEGQFMVQTGAKIKIKMPPVSEKELPEDVLFKALVDLGVKAENAQKLVDREVSFVPQWSLNFTDMLHGVVSEGKFAPATDAQKLASEVLFQVMQGQDEDGNDLTTKSRLDLLKKIPEEGWFLMRQNIENHTKYFPQLVDGKLFLDRVCNYADTIEELDAILTVFEPIHYCARVKFACSDTIDDKNDRLIAEAKAAICNKTNDAEIERAHDKKGG